MTLSLIADDDVSAHVLNIAGREVATICRDHACEAGTNTLVWSGCSSQGLATPAGAYLIEVTARNGAGAVSRSVTQVHPKR